MITTISDLCARLQIPRETQALAAQTKQDGLKLFVRAFILHEYGEMTLIGRGPNGKAERAGECYERVMGEKLHKSGRKI